MTATLSAARVLARVLHEGQVDMSGSPYIEHVDRVASGMTTYEEAATAYLHDVVEDTPLTLLDLLSIGFSTCVVEQVDALTRRKGEEYQTYIRRVAKGGPVARKVKLADLADHLRETSNILPESLVKRYEKAQSYLREYTYTKGRRQE